jgi:hypothetical protein
MKTLQVPYQSPKNILSSFPALPCISWEDLTLQLILHPFYCYG